MAKQADDIPGLARFTAFSRLSELELASLAALMGPPRKVARGDILLSEGDVPPVLYLLLAGWTASTITMADGNRQMIKIHMPGDVVGLPSLAMTFAVDTVSALSPATVSPVSLAALGRLFSENGRLAAILFLIAQEERVMLIDRLASVGCNAGPARIAALLLQLHTRARRYDRNIGDSFVVPLTQHQIGDLTGLASVQANRSIQTLRRERLIRWDRTQVAILDKAGLQRLSGLPERALAHEQAWLPTPAEST